MITETHMDGTIVIIAVIQEGITIKVISDGTEAGTVFDGLPEHVAKASAVARHGMQVPVFLGVLRTFAQKAGYDTPMGLAASLLSIAPQYVYFTHAPKEVKDLYDSVEARGGCLYRRTAVR